MRIVAACILALLMAGIASAQTSLAPDSAAPSVDSGRPMLTIPSGTRVPLTLKQAISTKTAKDGDPVYTETAFPFLVNDRVMIPDGTSIEMESYREVTVDQERIF